MTALRSPLAACALASGLGAALVPAAAQAHLVTTGMGPVCDGVAHFGASPEDYLPVIVLGLLAGLRGARQARLTMAALTVAWLAGGLASLGFFSASATALAAATALLFMVIGVLLAWNPHTRLWVLVSIATALGLVRGLDDLHSAPLELPTAIVLGSICASAAVLYALAASVTLPLQRLWMIVVVRVGGSWLAAIGVLLAGWLIRYGNAVH